MRHMVMRLPGEREPEFILMRPFTPRQKDNLAAWMVARNDGEHYGKLVVYRFPRQSLVFGPTQIVNRINQDTEVSRQISLWDQRGSEVIRGELLVIPIEESLHLRAAAVPARAGRAHPGAQARDRGAREPRGDGGDARGGARAALRRRDGRRPRRGAGGRRAGHGRGTGAAPAGRRRPRRRPPSAPRGDLARRARAHYDRARGGPARRRLGAYGEEMRRLGEVLEEMAESGGGAGGEPER